MKFMSRALLVLVFFPGVVLAAADETFEALLTAKSLKCSFGSGSVGEWESKSVNVKNSNWDNITHFDSIDINAKKARLIGNAASVDVAVLATPAGVTFVEQTSYGNLSFTTVFASYRKGSKEYIAVSSRHMLVLDKPLPSQYHGTCKIW